MAGKCIVLVCCAGLAVSAFGGVTLAQDKVPPAPPAPKTVEGDHATITFDAVSNDFGIIGDEKTHDTQFRFTNTGTAALEITSTNGSCGCTVPALEKKSYLPGESGVIKVTYNPHGRRGKQQTNVTVVSNDPLKPQVQLQVHSNIKPQIMIDPQVLTIGQVQKGTPAVLKATITSRDKALLPTVATPSMTSIEPKMLESVEVEVDGEMVTQTPIEVTVLPTADVGLISGQISIRTSDPTRHLQVTVTGEVVGDLEAKPARVQLSGLAPSATINTQVRIGSRTGKPFKIVKAADAPVGNGVLSVEVSEDNAVQPPAYVITLTGTAPATPGAFRGDIVLTTDIAGETTFKVPYFGFTRNAPARPVATPAPLGVWDYQPSFLLKSSVDAPNIPGEEGC